MQSGLTLTADVDARDHCVVVIKGTFIADERGELRLASEQQPIVRSDEHYGDPASSPVRLECEFVLDKPATDVVVVGKAVAPGSRTGRAAVRASGATHAQQRGRGRG